MGNIILIATHNKGKMKKLIAEFQDILPYKFISLDDLGLTYSPRLKAGDSAS